MVALTLLLPPFSFCPSKTFALSIEAEEKMGHEAAMQIRRYFELMDDDFVNQYFNELGQFLTIPLEIKHFPYRFYIIEDNTLNAFAIPGGHIFFFAGLIDVMESYVMRSVMYMPGIWPRGWPRVKKSGSPLWQESWQVC